MAAIHRTHKWQKLRAQVLAEEPCCWICGAWLDHDAPPRSPRSPTVDHVVPVAVDASLALVRSNCRACCWRCNASRGATLGNRMRGARRRMVSPSRSW